MYNIELIKRYEYLGRRYRFIYFEFSNTIRWEELVELKWWQKIFRTGGQDYVWKLIYSGHSSPLEKCLDNFNLGQKVKEQSR